MQSNYATELCKTVDGILLKKAGLKTILKCVGMDSMGLTNELINQVISNGDVAISSISARRQIFNGRLTVVSNNIILKGNC
jgi:hypothetical protein